MKKEHWISAPNLNPFDYNHICFGSKFSRNFSDVTLFAQSNSKYRREHFFFKEEILEIALFDIWLSNEDRSTNNPNLMFDLAKRNRFIPIDHQHIFNSSSLYNGVYYINFYDSILYYPVVKSLFKKDELKDKKLLERTKQRYYICIKECQEELEAILKAIPKDWHINSININTIVKKEIFNENWIRGTWTTFINFIQTLVNSY